MVGSVECRVEGRERIVAVGLLTEADLALLGPGFARLYPVDKAPHFLELLRAIDEADETLIKQGGERSPD
jgi:hypothetical protein